ncbi:MAG: hypothetical protein J3Q66DRAFT_402420 [Benniella sp.]|nr:MAG: hypothetical protein J3Q66DRAFT_402420 [Benniella sp.]
MPFNTLTYVFAVVLAFVSVVSAQTTTKVTVQMYERFCLLLPRHQGSSIARNLHNSVSYCTSLTSAVRHARELPPFFYQKIFFYDDPNQRYSQVTGRFNRTSFGLSANDNGGQADPAHPHGAQCVGFKYFVQFVEPNEGIYCLRCCHHKSDCPTNKPTKGCRAVIGGNY